MMMLMIGTLRLARHVSPYTARLLTCNHHRHSIILIHPSNIRPVSSNWTASSLSAKQSLCFLRLTFVFCVFIASISSYFPIIWVGSWWRIQLLSSTKPVYRCITVLDFPSAEQAESVIWLSITAYFFLLTHLSIPGLLKSSIAPLWSLQSYEGNTIYLRDADYCTLRASVSVYGTYFWTEISIGSLDSAAIIRNV